MLYLQELARQDPQTKKITIRERLPGFITEPCHLEVSYQVQAEDNFYLIQLHVKGDLSLQCQRCLEQFNYSYDNQTVVAVCRDDERAEQLLEYYECIVSTSLQVDLSELIIDELHLYAPQFHPEISDCSSEINQFLSEKMNHIDI